MKKPKVEAPQYLSIDHIAIAVADLEIAVLFFCDVLGFALHRRREIRGENTGMIAAEIEHNGIKFVLCQGTEPESQVSKLIKANGPGIAHVAFSVTDVRVVAESLAQRGLKFDTNVISGPGLSQIFSSRDTNSGFGFEFIQRAGEENFLQENTEELFKQLESSGKI